MTLEIEGKLTKLLPVQTGEGRNGQWTKQDFVLETFGEYPKKICFSTWNDKAKDIQAFPVGSLLKISFAAESREYNERWYTDLRAYRIDKLGAVTEQAVKQVPPVAEPPAVNETAGGQEKGDDLPF